MSNNSYNDTPEDIEYIYVAFITRKNGYRDYARNHGLRAWRIPVHKNEKR